jgi:N-acetyl-1-D-myo-inositol-2-amino-2-deoxy-alpha-D-glucopyranoside deacetylase
MQRILATFAHPDDETFTIGGTLAHFARRGIASTLVCATRGEAGEISDPSLATRENLGAVREVEMRCAAAALGVRDLIFLDYRDSGMAGTSENEDPRAFVNADERAVVARLVEIIRQQRPDVVITFDPKGGYGHPDHIAIHNWTVAAVRAAADGAEYAGMGELWQVPRFYYAVVPRSFFQNMQEMLAAKGVDTAEWEPFSQRAWPDEDVHLTLDITDGFAAKQRAFECHRTQLGADNPFSQLNEAEMRQLMGREYFVLAQPSAADAQALRGLFPDAA